MINTYEEFFYSMDINNTLTAMQRVYMENKLFIIKNGNMMSESDMLQILEKLNSITDGHSFRVIFFVDFSQQLPTHLVSNTFKLFLRFSTSDDY